MILAECWALCPEQQEPGGFSWAEAALCEVGMMVSGESTKMSSLRVQEEEPARLEAAWASIASPLRPL